MSNFLKENDWRRIRIYEEYNHNINNGKIMIKERTMKEKITKDSSTIPTGRCADNLCKDNFQKDILEKLSLIAKSLETFKTNYYDRRDLVKSEFLNYYNVDNTITTAGPTNPNDFDSPVYNRERVYESLQRKSPFIQVINHGIDSLYVLVSHIGTTRFTAESRIRPGETKEYMNVYELRLRSPTQGLPYTVTEYKTFEGCCPTSSVVTIPVSVVQLLPIEKALIQNQALPGIGVNWLGANLVPTQTPTMFRVTVTVSIVGVFSVSITNGANTQTVTLNNGIALVPGTLNMFNLLVHNGDVVNFSYSTTTGTIQVFRVQEVDAAVT